MRKLKQLSPAMRKAIDLCRMKGKLVRYPGGFWGDGSVGYHWGTCQNSTIIALSKRGLMEITKFNKDRSPNAADGWPVEVKLTEREEGNEI